MGGRGTYGKRAFKSDIVCFDAIDCFVGDDCLAVFKLGCDIH